MSWRKTAVALTAAVACVAAGAAGRRFLTEAPPGDGSDTEFTVQPGESFGHIAGRLQDEGLVVSARRLRLLARITGTHRSVRAGTYRLVRGSAPLRVLDELVAGQVVQRRVVVPEGFRIPQIAAAVHAALGIPEQEFRAAASDPDRVARLGARGPTLEGYLFPDTYLFPDGTTAEDVVDRMTEHFVEVWESLPAPRPDGYDRHALVTLASIVEAETPLAEEKPRVAAVYWNRLRQGMRLQADPTVRYGLDYWAPRLYFKQLVVDTPYNTYMHTGLPPGPIGSPGKDALAAVLSPLTPCDDFYFVASGRGGHVFSRTKTEHDRAVRAARATAAR